MGVRGPRPAKPFTRPPFTCTPRPPPAAGYDPEKGRFIWRCRYCTRTFEGPDDHAAEKHGARCAAQLSRREWSCACQGKLPLSTMATQCGKCSHWFHASCKSQSCSWAHAHKGRKGRGADTCAACEADGSARPVAADGRGSSRADRSTELLLGALGGALPSGADGGALAAGVPFSEGQVPHPRARARTAHAAACARRRVHAHARRSGRRPSPPVHWFATRRWARHMCMPATCAWYMCITRAQVRHEEVGTLADGGVDVRASTLGPDAGLGLFAGRPIRQHEVISSYYGPTVYREQLPAGFDTSYVMRLPNSGGALINGKPYADAIRANKANPTANGRYVPPDGAAEWHFGAAAMANDPRDAKRNNASLRYVKPQGGSKALRDLALVRPVLVATRDIEAGEEIFYSCVPWARGHVGMRACGHVGMGVGMRAWA